MRIYYTATCESRLCVLSPKVMRVVLRWRTVVYAYNNSCTRIYTCGVRQMGCAVCTRGRVALTLNRRLRTERSICGVPIKTSRRVRWSVYTARAACDGRCRRTDGRLAGSKWRPRSMTVRVPSASLVNWSIDAPPPSGHHSPATNRRAGAGGRNGIGYSGAGQVCSTAFRALLPPSRQPYVRGVPIYNIHYTATAHDAHRRANWFPWLEYANRRRPVGF